MQDIDWTAQIGKRVVYTKRNGNELFGTIKGVSEAGGRVLMVDLDLDNSNREHYYVPPDTVRLIPDDLADTLK